MASDALLDQLREMAKERVKNPSFSLELGQRAVAGQDPLSAIAGATEATGLQHEILPTVGGTLGAIGGGAVAGVPGAVVGAAGGAALGRTASPLVFGGPRPSLQDVGTTALTAAAGEAAFGLAGRGIGAAFRGRVAGGALQPEARAAGEAAERLGIREGMAPSVVGREGFAIAETEAAGMLSGRRVVRQAIERQLGELDGAIDNFGRVLGQAGDRETVGTAVMKAMERTHTKATGVTDKAWDWFRQTGRSFLPVVDVSPLRQKAVELANGTADASLKGELLKIAKGPASVPFNEADNLRKMFAIAARETPRTYGAGGAPALHKAIEESFEQAARASGVPDVVYTLRMARKASADEHRLFTYSDIGRRLHAAKRGATAIGTAGKSGKPEPLADIMEMVPSQLGIMREAVTGSTTGVNPAWSGIKRRALTDSLEASTTYVKGLRQDAISGPKLQDYIRKHDAQLRVLLDPAEYQTLRDIASVAEGLSASASRVGTGFGRARYTMGTVGTLGAGAALGYALSGLGLASVGSALGAGATYYFVPRILARIATDQASARRTAMLLSVVRESIGVGGRGIVQGGAAFGSTALSERLREPASPRR